MSARIAKGGGGRRAAPARSKGKGGGGSSRGGGSRRQRQEELLESLGFAPGTGRRIGRWGFVVVTLAAAIAAIVGFRLPQLAGLAIGEGIGQAGFTLRHVEVRGNNRVALHDIYNVAFDQQSMAMPLVDLTRTRERLLGFGWIRDARVSRRLPDTLVIEVNERQPVAIWQNGGRLSLIDAEGVVLEPVRIEAMPDLPRLIGPAANRRFSALSALLEAAPRLRPQVTDATWVGDRRWDIRFQSGETLSLPEGEEEARRSIQRFQVMDQQDSMLGRGFARIDMRDPRRVYVRVTREPGARVPAFAPAPDPGPVPQDLSRTI
jgi:cell division protein FtsQ